MGTQKERKSALVRHLIAKGGKENAESWNYLSKLFNLSKNQCDHTWRNFKSGSFIPISGEVFEEIKSQVLEKDNYIGELEDRVVRFEEDLESSKAELILHTCIPIRTLEDLIERTKIDITKWEIIKYVQNSWGNPKNQQWQVKAWLSPRMVKTEDIISKVLANYQSPYKVILPHQIFRHCIIDRPCSAFISLTDIHIDKNTRDRQSIEHKANQYQEVLNTLVQRATAAHNLEEIVLVIGHDFFNTDTYHNTTTNYTQQYHNADWDHAYEIGFGTLVTAIGKLKQFCEKLHVYFVPGNHDRTKAFYLAHALEVYFKADQSINFDRTSESTKVYTFGECFIGMHHGDTNLESLPLYFASKYYQQWGQCKYKEIGVGDKHHRKTLKLKTKMEVEDTEDQGVRVFMTPSLGGFGQWDREKLYDNSIQAGIIRVYDKHKGKISEFEERVDTNA